MGTSPGVTSFFPRPEVSSLEHPERLMSFPILSAEGSPHIPFLHFVFLLKQPLPWAYLSQALPGVLPNELPLILPTPSRAGGCWHPARLTGG